MLTNRAVSVKAFTPVYLFGVSFHYAAPEVFKAIDGNQSNVEFMHQPDVHPKRDIYALSMVMYEMMTGTRPWDTVSIPEIGKRVLSNERPVFPATDDERVKRLMAVIENCWLEDPRARPTAQNLIDA
jgi:serine/threonine protein kinase